MYSSLTTCEDLPFGCAMEWHYWGIGHGKGPHDGVGTWLKQVIQKEQLKANGVILHNASIDVVNFLKANMLLPHTAYATTKRQLQQVFWEINVGDVNKNHGFDCRNHWFSWHAFNPLNASSQQCPFAS